MTSKSAAERRTNAQHAVASALADSARAVRTRRRAILRAICQSLGWAHGALWQVAGDAGVLTLRRDVARARRVAQSFDAASKAMQFAPGVGLPGACGRAAARLGSRTS